VLVADEVGGAPQVVVDELLEEHERDRTNTRSYISDSPKVAWATSGWWFTPPVPERQSFGGSLV
jgi:hypothetical protein